MSKKYTYQAPSTGMTPEEAKEILDGGSCDNPDLIAEAMNIRQRTTRHLGNPSVLPPHHPDYVPPAEGTQPVARSGPSDEDLALPQADYFAKVLAFAKSMEDYNHLEKLWTDWHKGVRRKPKTEKWEFTQEEVQDHFYYYEGELYHRYHTGNNIKAGTMAGTRGYRDPDAAPRRVSFKGHQYSLDSLIWFYHTGEPRVQRLIHKNSNRDDCSFENLLRRT